ncbi:MAG: phosphoribosylformylglycinamidine synthase subunit PurL [Deltaproteobacteria bacterium]|nr:phosphoribosylformylglycinamidine synthase subunit PurL [Deltaproteobacteria bacterium]MCL5791597.1 phosphoribosylformylglycinamidine synthase subunit PurL [Deltaproteobacteria bacterium]
MEKLDRMLKELNIATSEYKKIVKYLGREPNITELWIFSAMWSEHCSYKSSKVYLKRLPSTGKQVLIGPGENAGAVSIGNGLAVIFKMESHNHPSFIEPYNGAATGVGGILRDVFTMGARPVAILDSLRFGEPDNDKMRYLIDGVVSGIAGYGNCMGIPTVGGEIYFDDSYKSNILVNAMAVGIANVDRIFLSKAYGVGNPVFYVGSKTGRDGIHGATMASASFSEETAELKPTVQVGDPFMEKLLMEACLELMQTDHIVAIQDMGAAGLTSSSVEMAAKGGLGIEIDLDRVPTREQGMLAHEVMLSESQERMLIIAKKGHEKAVEKIFKKWGLDVGIIGKLIKSPEIIIKTGNEIKAQLPLSSLVDISPVYIRYAKMPDHISTLKDFSYDELPEPGDYKKTLLDLLASPSIGNKAWAYKQYDYMVGTDTVIKPGGGTALIRIKGTKKGIAITTDGNGRYTYLDPYAGSVIAVCEAARNIACAGAKPIAITDCLNYGNPEKPEVMWQFIESINGIESACMRLGIPVVSGNVSFYNETEGKSIFPTPVIGMVGLIDDVNKRITPDFKNNGDLIITLGNTLDELGGSEYLKLITGAIKGSPPSIKPELENRIIELILTMNESGIVKSATDCSEGGLGVAIAESAISGDIGAKIKIKWRYRPDIELFSETQHRILITIDRSDLKRLKLMADKNNVPFQTIGTVNGKSLSIDGLFSIPVNELKNVYNKGLQ